MALIIPLNGLNGYCKCITFTTVQKKMHCKVVISLLGGDSEKQQGFLNYSQSYTTHRELGHHFTLTRHYFSTSRVQLLHIRHPSYHRHKAISLC